MKEKSSSYNFLFSIDIKNLVLSSSLRSSQNCLTKEIYSYFLVYSSERSQESVWLSSFKDKTLRGISLSRISFETRGIDKLGEDKARHFIIIYFHLGTYFHSGFLYLTPFTFLFIESSFTIRVQWVISPLLFFGKCLMKHTSTSMSIHFCISV